MGQFRNSDEVYDILGALLDWAWTQPHITRRLERTQLLFKLILHDPDAIFIVDCRKAPPTWAKGDLASEADVELAMSADLANRFWQGKVNLLASLSRREILAKGRVTRAMGLLGILKPLEEQYLGLLRSKGRKDLIE